MAVEVAFFFPPHHLILYILLTPRKHLSQWSFGFALDVNGRYMTSEFISSGTAKVVHVADVTALSKVISPFQTSNRHI